MNYFSIRTVSTDGTESISEFGDSTFPRITVLRKPDGTQQIWHHGLGVWSIRIPANTLVSQTKKIGAAPI